MIGVLLALVPASLAAQPSPGAEDSVADEQAEARAEANRAPLAQRRSLTPADFAQFAPRTALDMVLQVPGFTIREGGSERGLGQADTNVLINGQRITAKSNSAVDALGRIPAGDVVRLEIVDGASLDIAGLAGQVLNLVTSTSGAVSGRFRYSPQFRSEGTKVRWGNSEVSVSGGGANSDWTLSLENNQQRFGEAGPEFVTDVAGNLIDMRQERLTNSWDRPSLAATYTRTAANKNVLGLTGSVTGFLLRLREVSQRGNALDGERTRLFRFTEDEFNYELSADYDFAALGSRSRIIVYRRFENSPTISSVKTDFADGRAPTGSVFARQANEAESVLRAEQVFAWLGGDWQVSLEGANNVLDIESSLEGRDASGNLQPIAFPGASSRVTEDRAEATTSYGRALSPKLRLQTSLGGEYSTIRQSGPFGLTRSFVRPKGFVTLDWQANPSLDISTRIERVVGQLSFFDFIASVNVNQDQVDVTNANLVPPQSWLVQVEASQRYGALGSITLRSFFEDVSDIVDQIPIASGGQAPGNIASALRYGVTMDATLLSEPLGWPGARLDLFVDILESEVLDPLLGTRRRISQDNYDILEIVGSFRQDFAGSNWATGFEFEWDREAPEIRLDEFALGRESFAAASIFVENKDVAGLTLRGRIGNVLDRANNFSRTVFIDRRAGLVALREERFRNQGTVFTLDIEGSF